MKYQVRRQASQLMLGRQSVVTIYNEGPNTVYFGDNASVAPGNGFPLAPTGQMTWQSDSELWACTARDSTSIRTDPNGFLSDNARSSFSLDLYQSEVFNAVGQMTPIVETGFCQSLGLEIECVSTSFVVNNLGLADFSLDWYDSQENFIKSDKYTVGVSNSNVFEGANLTLCEVAVSGAFVRVKWNSTTTTASVKIRGTSETTLAFEHYQYGALEGLMGTLNSYAYGYRRMSWVNWLPGNTGFLAIPSWGQRLTINFRRGQSTTEIPTVSLEDRVGAGGSRRFFGSVRFPDLAGSQTIVIPTSETLFINGSLLGTINQISLVWSD